MREIKLLLSAKLCAVIVLCIAPFHSAAKTPPALSHRSYRCYIYVTPLGSMATITAMLFAPPRPKVLKNLKGVKLGQKQTCGNVGIVFR